MPVADLTRQHGFAENTFYRWKSKYGGMEVSEAKRLRDLEAENAKLKRLQADGVARSTVRYQSYGRDDEPLRTRLKQLAEKDPRYGYPMLHTMLKGESLVENRKGNYRIYA